MYTICHEDGARIINITLPTPLDVGPVNCTLYIENGECALIDAGVDTDEAWNIFKEALKESGFSLIDIKRILITHHHFDHIGLINRIQKEHQVPVFSHMASVPWLKRDPEFLRYRFSFFQQLYQDMGCKELGEAFIEQSYQEINGHNHLKITGEINLLKDSEKIGSLEVIEVPGHAPDHLIFYDAARRWLIAGDFLLSHISSNAIVEMDMEGNRTPTFYQYRKSLVRSLALQVDVIFPGHGDVYFELGSLIEARLKRMESKAYRVKSLISDKWLSPFEIAVRIYPSKYRKQFYLVMSEIIGILDFLEIHNEVEKQKNKNIWQYRAAV